MYELLVDDSFSAAHFLRDYEGRCRNLHGHNWRVSLAVRVEGLDHAGIGIDFRMLKKHLREVLERVDHCNLNETAPFLDMNPTAENISRWLFGLLSEKIDSEGAKLWSVRVWESESASVIYTRE